jgi:hypothetical protein
MDDPRRLRGHGMGLGYTKAAIRSWAGFRTRVGHRGRQRAECGLGSIDDGIDIEHGLLTMLGKRYVTYLGKESYFETTLKLRQIAAFEQGI